MFFSLSKKSFTVSLSLFVILLSLVGCYDDVKDEINIIEEDKEMWIQYMKEFKSNYKNGRLSKEDYSDIVELYTERQVAVNSLIEKLKSSLEGDKKNRDEAIESLEAEMEKSRLAFESTKDKVANNMISSGAGVVPQAMLAATREVIKAMRIVWTVYRKYEKANEKQKAKILKMLDDVKWPHIEEI